MKRIKVICMTIVIAVLCLGVFVQGYADWKNAPNSNNYSDESGEDVILTNKNKGRGIREFDSTSKCYKGASKYTVRAKNVYTMNNSTAEIGITFRANYWHPTKEVWQKGTNTYYEKLKSTYVNKKVVKRSTKADKTVNAQKKDYYHYGRIEKSHTSVYIGGTFEFYKK